MTGIQGAKGTVVAVKARQASKRPDQSGLAEQRTSLLPMTNETSLKDFKQRNNCDQIWFVNEVMWGD